MQSIERWEPVLGYEGAYEVSNLGRVRGVDRIDPQGRAWRGRILSPKTHRNGYLCVNLWRNGRGAMKYVHRLVLESFVGPCPEGFEACHGDGDATNNAAKNLRWDSPSSNAYDKVAHRTHPKTRRTHCPRSHLLEEPNLVPGRLEKYGHRACRACDLAWRKSEPGNLNESLADAYYADLMASVIT